MKNWSETRLKDVCSIKGGKRLPNGHSLTVLVTNHPYIKARDIRNGKIITDNFEYLEESTFTKISRYIVNTNDVCITVVANIGDVGIVTNNLDGANLTENAVKLTVFDKKLNPHFLNHLLSSKYYKNYMSLLASGTAQSKLGIYKIEQMLITFPKLFQQQQIVEILSAYDDLIETNNQRIATLEQLAQQIYKEWFVRMRFPGWENTLFHHGIPEDWTVCRLESLCRNLTDGTHDSPRPASDGHYLITGKHISRDNFIDFSQAYFISEADHKKISDRSSLDEGDIIFSNIGTIGSCAIIKGENDFSVKNVLIFKPKEKYLTTYLFYLLTDKSTLEQLLLSASGASQQFIGLTFVRDFKVLVPKDNLLKQFNILVEPLVEQRFAIKESNLILTKTRNLLLPRLISGKLSIKQAEALAP